VKRLLKVVTVNLPLHKQLRGAETFERGTDSIQKMPEKSVERKANWRGGLHGPRAFGGYD
jgi:hypothetical protein